MIYNILYIGDGANNTSVYHFPDEVAGQRWNSGVHAIKEHISAINDGLEREGRMGEGTYNDYSPWLNQVKHFINVFGAAAVPSDIQLAMNSVERGCCCPVTVWPVPKGPPKDNSRKGKKGKKCKK